MAEESTTSSRHLAALVVGILVMVAAIAVAATTGDSWAVRLTLILVAADVGIRLVRWGKSA